MSALQSVPAQFLDRTLAAAADRGLLTASVRSALLNELHRGAMQVLDAIFPGRVCTEEHLERVFAAVRVVVGHGLFTAASGNPVLDWGLLQQQGLFRFSRQGAEALLPLFANDALRQDAYPLAVYVQQRVHPPTPLLVYRNLVLTDLEPQRYLARVNAHSERASALRRLAQAQWQVFATHRVALLDASREWAGVIPSEVTLQILLHRHRTWSHGAGPNRVDVGENLRHVIQCARSGQWYWPFDDPDWQQDRIPEIEDPVLRAQFCADRSPLPEPETFLRPQRFADIRGLWTGEGFPGQTHLTRLDEFLGDGDGAMDDPLLLAERLGPLLLSLALTGEPVYPDSGAEKKALLRRLRAADPNWQAVRVWVGNQSQWEPERSRRVQLWIDRVLIPETAEWAKRLRASSPSAITDILDQGIFWLLDMQADI